MDLEKIGTRIASLRTSLSTLYTSFYGEAVGGYYQGKEAYQAWIQGLAKESDFQLDADRENVLRRLCVNDSMLCSLKDARQAASCTFLRDIP